MSKVTFIWQQREYVISISIPIDGYLNISVKRWLHFTSTQFLPSLQ